MKTAYICNPRVVQRGQKKLPTNVEIEANDSRQAALIAAKTYGWVITEVDGPVTICSEEEMEAIEQKRQNLLDAMTEEDRIKFEQMEDNAFPKLSKPVRCYDYNGIKVRWDGKRYSPTDSRRR